MITLCAIWTGFALDLLLGDPVWLPHPVVWMGRGIRLLEKRLRGWLPATAGGERLGGVALAALLPLLSFALSWGLLSLCGRLHPGLRFAVESWCCYQILATKELWRQSGLVYRALLFQGLPAARQAVGRIVGRDTAALDEEAVIRAAVETVAENASDGVVAPLFFLTLGGVPLGMLYKAVNTLDSMVGYQNETYRHFGWASARLDDLLNLLPSRLCALCMAACAPWVGLSAGGAWRIWQRDRRNHASPNSAQTEAACAGALGVRLGGDGLYAGRLVQKPAIGDARRALEPRDIPRAGRLMLASGLLALLLCTGARLAACRLWGYVV